VKEKHLQARIKQCLALAECSNCPWAKFGAAVNSANWFAAGGGIARMGPYPTQQDAWRALTLVPSLQEHGPYPADARVWPEWAESPTDEADGGIHVPVVGVECVEEQAKLKE
jgi:hypothetical protein